MILPYLVNDSLKNLSHIKHAPIDITDMMPYTINIITRFKYLFTSAKLNVTNCIKKHDITTPTNAIAIYFAFIAKNFISFSLNMCLNTIYGFHMKVITVLLIIVPITIPIIPNFSASIIENTRFMIDSIIGAYTSQNMPYASLNLSIGFLIILNIVFIDIANTIGNANRYCSPSHTDINGFANL